MSTNKVLIGGGFVRDRDTVSLDCSNPRDKKTRLYYLQNLNQETIQKAQAALQQVTNKKYTYDGSLKDFEKDIQEKPYLLRERRCFRLIKRNERQSFKEPPSNQTHVLNQAITTFNDKVAVGNDFKLQAKTIHLTLHQSSLEISGPLSDTLIPPALKKLYCQNRHIELLVEPRKLSIKRIYTRLAIIGEREQEEKRKQLQQVQPGQREEGRIPTHESFFEPKKAIELENLFEQEALKEAFQQRVVIYGSAGVGKSTLCQFIAYYWARKKLWPRFTQLFLVRLRNLNESFFPLDNKYTAAYLLAQECRLDLVTIQSFLKNPSSKASSLLLLDGEDELPSIAGSGDKTAYLRPAFQEMLQNFPHIVVTSRPQMTSVPDICCRLEILGFDQKGINDYVDNFFGDDQTKKTALQEQLKKPHIKSLAHIPINLEIFCSLINNGITLIPVGEDPTITSIYRMITGWLFKRFLKDKTLMNESQIREDPSPGEDPEISKITCILEEIAWKAMQQNTLYLSDEIITEICRQHGFRNTAPIKELGIFRIKDKLGHFIHLTFQEYFAATYLARFYTEGKRKEARKILQEIKFNPQYSITLPLTAGVLSCHRESAALKAFFKDLLSKPYDLAVTYALRLLACCFEECQDLIILEQHYNSFIEQVVVFIQENISEEIKADVLLGHPRLLQHEKILQFFEKLLANQTKQKEIAGILYRLAFKKQPFSEKIFILMINILKNSNIDYEALSLAAEALVEVVKNGQALPKEVVGGLFALLRDSQANSIARGLATKALVEVVKNGQTPSREVVEGLLAFLRDPQANSWYRGSAAKALVEVVKNEQTLPKEVVEGLLAFLGDPQASSIPRGLVAEAIEEVAKNGQTRFREVMEGLLALLKDPQANSIARGLETKALVEVVKNGQALPKEVIERLLAFLKDPEANSWDRVSATRTLVEVVKIGQTLPKEVVEGILAFLRDSEANSWARSLGAEALVEVVKIGQALSNEVVEGFLTLLKDPQANSIARGLAAKALVEVSKNGQALPKEVVGGLFALLRDPQANSGDLISAAKALGKLAKSGQALSKEVVEGLLVFLRSPYIDSWVRGRAAEALGEMAKNGLAVPQEELTAICNDSDVQRSAQFLNSFAEAICKFCYHYEPQVLRKLFFLTGRAFYFHKDAFYTSGHATPLITGSKVENKRIYLELICEIKLNPLRNISNSETSSKIPRNFVSDASN